MKLGRFYVERKRFPRGINGLRCRLIAGQRCSPDERNRVFLYATRRVTVKHDDLIYRLSLAIPPFSLLLNNISNSSA